MCKKYQEKYHHSSSFSFLDFLSFLLNRFGMVSDQNLQKNIINRSIIVHLAHMFLCVVRKANVVRVFLSLSRLLFLTCLIQIVITPFIQYIEQIKFANICHSFWPIFTYITLMDLSFFQRA